jgi:hypothetical protein
MHTIFDNDTVHLVFNVTPQILQHAGRKELHTIKRIDTYLIVKENVKRPNY